MHKNALVSVVIPCWNAERFVLTAVLSALSQTYPNIEVILVDDGSTDASIAALARIRDRIRLISIKNSGACVARDVGLENSHGQFIKFLDADDFLFPEAIELQVQAIAKLEDCYFTVGRGFSLHQDSGVLTPHGERSALSTACSDLDKILSDIPVISSALYRRDMVEQVNGFRDLPTRQDFDFFIRILLAGYIPREDGVPVFVYRQHTGGSRLSKRRSARDYWAMSDMYRHYLAEINARKKQQAAKLMEGLAKSAWATGREALRAGHKDIAGALFGAAAELHEHGCIRGSAAYTSLVKLVGPFRAEKLGRLSPSKIRGGLV